MNVGGNRAWITNTGTIVGESGTAMLLVKQGAAIENHGRISGAIDASGVTGASLLNHGTVTGETMLGLGGSITNYGTLSRTSASQTGTVFNAVGARLEGYTATGTADDPVVLVTNDGWIGAISLGGGQDNVINTGVITQIATGEGAGSIRNSGTISGRVNGGSGADTLVNSGTIGDVVLGGGANLAVNEATGVIAIRLYVTDLFDETSASTVTNHGVIGADLGRLTPFGSVLFGDGGDTLTNDGTIYGLVTMNGGDDTVDTAYGAIVGKVDLGDGEDSYAGSAGIDRVIGGAGDDAVDLGAGDDMFRAGSSDGARDGDDAVDGGDGSDTYSAAAITQAVLVDLSAGITGKASARTRWRGSRTSSAARAATR